MISFGSVCSGIEAASVAFTPLGWKAAWFSEIEPFPCAVLKHHYSDVPNYGDMTALPERILSGEIEAPDMLCGGTPCQAFSVAGLRNSLDDHRGNLTLTFVEIANAIDERRLVRGLDPAIIFWENVPGVLNTKDNAFGCFLAGLAGESVPLEPPGGRWTNAGFIDGPQRAVAWRVLDAQYFGVAQRRRRVFVVASAGEDFDPAAVLFEFDGVRRDTAPSRETGNEVARCVTAGTGLRYDAETDDLIPAYALQGNMIGRNDKAGPQGAGHSDDGVMYTLTKADVHGVAAPIALQDVSGRDKAQNGRGWNDDGTMYTLDAAATQGVMALDYEYNAHGVDEATGPLLKGSPTGGGHPLPAVMAYSFDSLASNSMKSANPDNGCNAVEVSRALDTSRGLDPSCNQGGIGVVQTMAVFLQDDMSAKTSVELAGTLRREAGGAGACVVAQMQVRRLTPTECERLQGFPDGYTNIPWRGKPESPDGPRYKALGNSWAVPVVRWIGERINRAL